MIAHSVITLGNIMQVVSSVTTVTAIEIPVGLAIGPLTAVLICRFILALRRADRDTATTPSSPSGNPSLVFAGGSNPDSSRATTLPEFVAALGSEVHTGMYFLDPVSADTVEDVVQAVGGGDESNIGKGDIELLRR
ncbi:hypothetical protein GSI_14758 [Ganoderma sinense ZZ0214-1]|uniref:Uncharacterized protein n=1 Tax=Ganoderma sinense ZZ0214-1 TaxID=1077348 RepID=A0A2G8RPL6_9APHY|nr:hypothetical protein GSI_14758 [Ganoderma sinense ZZ0214-1]